MWNHHEWMPHVWGGGVIMGLFWLLLFIVIILAVFWAVRESGEREFAGGPPGRRTEDRPWESPREILDRRYAEGELSREEYEEMKDELAE